MNPVRVFACEAQPIVLEGLARVLAGDSEFEYLGSTPGIADALDAVREKQPDVLLVDQSAGLKQIFQFISDVKSSWPRCQPVLWVNDLAEIDCFRALQLGARGILKKTVSIAAMRECLLRCEPRRSVDRKLALRTCRRRYGPPLVAAPDAARKRHRASRVRRFEKQRDRRGLAITPGTVKVHLMHIFEKTGVKDRFELAVQGRRLLGTEHASPSRNSAKTGPSNRLPKVHAPILANR